MQSKPMTRSRLAGLVMSATAAVLAIGASTAVRSASAASRDASLLHRLPPAAESAALASVLSETPYQKFVVLACTGDPGSSACRARLPTVPARQRLVIQFASCIASTSEGGEMGNINLAVADTGLTRIYGGHFIAPTFRGGAASHIHVASQPMLLTVDAGRVLHIEATPNGGVLTLARCGLSGVRQRLG
jgi:hypothetical protein